MSPEIRNDRGADENADPKKLRLIELLQQKGAQQEEYPLSFAQQRLWFLEQWKPNSALYSIPFSVQLTGALDVEVLRRSLNEIVRRHEILRTAFVMRQDEPVQVISPALNIEAPLVDLSALAEEPRKVELNRIRDADARQPFDLTHVPLLRCKVFRLSPREHLLFINAHHIIFDGWSADVLLKDLAQIYRAYSAGNPSPLPEMALQYADFSEWQREYLQGEVFQKQLAYWKAQFDPAPPILELPADHPRPVTQTHNGASWEQLLPSDIGARLEEFCQQERVSQFMLFLAVLDVLLYRYTGQPDIVVGMPIAGRNRSEIEGMIGFFVNMLPLRVQMDGAMTFRDLLKQARQVALDGYEHQDLPFEKLVEALGMERDAGHSPVFQVMLVLQNTPAQAYELPGLRMEYPQEMPTGTAKYDLALTVNTATLPPCIAFEYNVDVFKPETIVQFAAHYQILLQNAIANPDDIVANLPILSEDEQRRLIEEWGKSGREYPATLSLYEAFRMQARQTPHQPVTIHGNESMTYQDLDNRVGNLASLIRSLQE